MHLVDGLGADVVVYLIDNLSEIGRSVQLAVVQSALVTSNHFLDAVDLWVENIAVQSETVGASLSVRRDGAAKAIQIDLLTRVVELKDVADALNRVQVLVAVRILIVE